MLLWQHLSLEEKWLPDNKLRCNLICSSRSKCRPPMGVLCWGECKPPMCVCFAGVSVVTRAGLGNQIRPWQPQDRPQTGVGGVIAIVDGGGGGSAVNKELRREVREIYRTSRWPARPCLRPTGGPAQKCASAPRGIARYARWPVQPWL